VAARYRDADVFVLPCVTDHLGWHALRSAPVLCLEVGLAIPFRPITDGIPNVLAEAMASGVPVISTPVAGVPELVVHGRTGLLVPERDAEALATTIQSLIDDPSRRAALARNGLQAVIAQFDRAKNVRDLVAIFHDFAGRAPAPRDAVAIERVQRTSVAR
jgi:glycosyltransferase involved in cell wall biosynthesis